MKLSPRRYMLGEPLDRRTRNYGRNMLDSVIGVTDDGILQDRLARVEGTYKDEGWYEEYMNKSCE